MLRQKIFFPFRRFGQGTVGRASLLSMLCLMLLTAGLFTGPITAAELPTEREEEAAGQITGLVQPTADALLPEEETAGPAEEETAGPAEEEPPAAQVQTENDQWNLVLVNRDSPLPEDFAPPELTDIGNGQKVDSRIADALRQMLDDAQTEGVRPIVCSAYRTHNKQVQLYERKVRYYKARGYKTDAAKDKAAFWVARPDTSEHQVGLAVDIVDAEYQVLNEKQEKTAAQQWLMAHCTEYGFILRYPTDKSAVTNVGYEPWHYRYVGVDAAREITQRGVCLEEYLTDS